MAEAVAERAGRRLSGVDAFLWLLRIVLIVSIAVGAFNSLTSGRLSGQQWRDLIVFGVALMTPAALEWIATRQITSHWSYFAAGGTLILTGLGLATWFVLLMILQELTTRDARARSDLAR